jgi:hypothetical protein
MRTRLASLIVVKQEPLTDDDFYGENEEIINEQILNNTYHQQVADGDLNNNFNEQDSLLSGSKKCMYIYYFLKTVTNRFFGRKHVYFVSPACYCCNTNILVICVYILKTTCL